MEFLNTDLLCLSIGWIYFSLWNSRMVLWNFSEFLNYLFSLPLSLFLLVSINAAVARTCKTFWAKHSFNGVWIGGPADREVRRHLQKPAVAESRQSLFLFMRAAGRPPSTSFLAERAVPCFHFLSAAARPAAALCVWLWTGDCAGHQTPRLQNIVLCNPHQSQMPNPVF